MVLSAAKHKSFKPYLSFSDSHPAARNGFAEQTADYALDVQCDDVPCTKEVWRDIEYILSQDPRPAYQDDPEREYKMNYKGNRVTFVVKDKTVIVKKIEKI